MTTPARFAVLGVLACACGGGGGDSLAPVLPLTKLSVSGTQFVDSVSGAPVQLKGITFTSGVWQWTAEHPEAASLPNVAFMQGDSDFARVHNWGVNVVSLYISYDWFETPTSDGWAWFDQMLDTCNKYGFYVIPSLVVYPVGGLRGGPAFWASASAKTNVINFWKAFAARYAGRKEIVGLDVLNEPQGTDVPTIVAYQTQLVDAVRTVDPSAIVFIEPQWGDAIHLQAIDRDSLVYVSHFYEPMHYTGQGFYWISNGNIPLGVEYPGEMVIANYGATPTWMDVNPMRSGTASWTRVEENPVAVPVGPTRVVYPYLTGWSASSAVEIDLDDIEYAVLPGGVGTPSWHPVLGGDFEPASDEATHWNFLSPANVERIQDSTTGNWYLKLHGCDVNPHCTAPLTDFWVGTLGGIPVNPGDQVAYRFRLRVPSGSGLGGVGSINAYHVTEYWDKAKLESTIASRLVDFSVAHNAPIFVGEFTPSLAAPGDSKIAWTTDVIDILNQNGLSWTFYVYRENWPKDRRLLGLYNGPVGTPTSGCVEESELIPVIKAGLE